MAIHAFRPGDVQPAGQRLARGLEDAGGGLGGVERRAPLVLEELRGLAARKELEQVVGGPEPAPAGAQQGEAYANTFHSIPSDTAYRPPRETPKPKLYGVLNAKVDASGSGEYAEVNDQGQYKVKLPFDLTGKGDAQASRFVRKAEPYAGPGYGQHFPLHSDCEVLLTCVDPEVHNPRNLF